MYMVWIGQYLANNYLRVWVLRLQKTRNIEKIVLQYAAFTHTNIFYMYLW